MAKISEYIYSLLILSASAAVITMLLPEGSKLTRHMKFLCGIVITSLLLLPLGSVLGELPQLVLGDIDFDVKEGDTAAYSESVIDEACRILQQRITEDLYDRFDTEPLYVTVYTNGDPQNLTVDRVAVCYRKNNKLLFTDTEKYLEDILGSECDVIVSAEVDQP